MAIGLVLAGLGVWSASRAPAPPALQRADGPLLTSERLNRDAGLYTLADGSRVLLAPSARGGFALYEAVDHGWQREDRLLRHIRPERARWVAEDVDGQVVPFEWTAPARGFRWGPSSAPQSATPVDDPAFDVIAVDYASDVALAATILKPRAPSAVPGVVIVHGSGHSDRDNLWYTLLSRVLAEAGFAVLLPDKRGSGRSEGDWRDASFDALAADARAAVDVLEQQPGIDPDRIGLLGISQGGWIGPLAAHGRDDIDFVVNVSGAALTPREQTTHEIRQEVLAGGVPEMLVPVVMSWAAAGPAKRLPEWWRQNGDFDPLPLWRSLRQPALVIYGMRDEQDNVPVERSVTALRHLGRPECELQVVTIPDAGHAMLDQREHLHPAFVTALVDWLRQVAEGRTCDRTPPQGG